MSGRPSHALIQALELIKGGMTAYAAAKQTGLNVGTIYRSAQYKALKQPPPKRRKP